MACEIDELFGIDAAEAAVAEATTSATTPPGAPPLPLDAASAIDDEVDSMFGVQSAKPATQPPTIEPAHSATPSPPRSDVRRKKRSADATQKETSTTASAAGIAATPAAHTAPVRLSTAESERLHAASVRAAAAARRSAPSQGACSAAAAAAGSYKPLLSNRDIIFAAPILSGGDDPFSADAGSSSCFQNAPTSFSTNPHFASGPGAHLPFMPQSTEELARMLHERDDVPAAHAAAMAAAVAAGSSDDATAASASSSSASAFWPISMRGKSVREVSQSTAMKAKARARVELEKAQELKEASETMPIDSHVHGPGYGDHTRAKAHWDGYMEMRVLKLGAQSANADIYAALTTFQTDAQRAEQAALDEQESARKRRKLERQERREAEATRPDDVPFALGQSSHAQPSVTSLASTASAAASASSSSSQLFSSTQLASATPSTARLSVRSHSRSRPVPTGSIFAGVVAYINGDTETRLAGALAAAPSDPPAAAAAPCASELSSVHLSNLVKLGGGHVLPYASRKQLTHYVVDHLSLSKTKAEMHALIGGGKAVSGAAARHIHFVKPAWIRACMQAGRRVSEDAFALLQDQQHVNLLERWRT